MPRGRKSNKDTPQKANIKTITCLSCGKSKKPSEFYASSSVFNASTGKIPYCKQCCIDLSCDFEGNIDINNFKNLLERIDKPFLPHILQSAYEEGKKINSHPIGLYFKNINSLDQYSNWTWKDSMSECHDNNEITPENIQEYESKMVKNFVITDEMIARWGSNYSKKQIMDLEKFYNDMKMTHNIVTPQHIKALIMMCKMQLKMDMYLENNDMTSFEKLHRQYQALLQSSGLRPIDKVGGDEATGMRSFSAIFEEVEKDGFIEPVPIEVHQDIVDRTIMYILNYTLKLLNQTVLTEPPIDTPKVDDNNG